jgi:hypothetical protein
MLPDLEENPLQPHQLVSVAVAKPSVATTPPLKSSPTPTHEPLILAKPKPEFYISGRMVLALKMVPSADLTTNEMPLIFK